VTCSHQSTLRVCCFVQIERCKQIRALKHGGGVSASESRARLMMSSCSTDQFYNYSTKVNLREPIIPEHGGPSVPFVVIRHMSFAATETEGGDSIETDDTRTLASEPGVSSTVHSNAFPLLSIGRRAGSCGRLADIVSSSNVWKMRGRRMAVDMGAHETDAAVENDFVDDVTWRRGRRMAVDMSYMCDEVPVDVDQIVGTGGITERYATDTGSEDSITASFKPVSLTETRESLKHSEVHRNWKSSDKTTTLRKEVDETCRSVVINNDTVSIALTQDDNTVTLSGTNGHVNHVTSIVNTSH